METLLYILFSIICVLLIFIVLIQQGKGAGVGFSMGGASQAMFGGSGGRDVFIKVTAGLAVAFGVICIVLARMAVGDASGYRGAMANVPAAPAPRGLPGLPAGAPGAPVPLKAAPAPLKAAPAPLQAAPAPAQGSAPAAPSAPSGAGSR